MARPNKGVMHVDAVKGTKESKRRARLILATIAGERSVKEACEELGISPSQFANLRTEAIQGLVSALEPRPAGRPPRATAESTSELELKQRNTELEHQNRLLRTQAELSLLHKRQAVRSKRGGPTTPRPASPRSDAADGAVP